MAWLVVGACALLAPACRQVEGIREVTSVEAACTACVDSKCGAQESQCRANDSCGPRLDCALGCDPADVTCALGCEVQAVADVNALGAIESCRATSCGVPCGVTCGAVLPITPPAKTAACASCVSASCCPQATACAASPDCLRGLECARGQTTPDAIQVCSHGPPYNGGSAAYDALDACVRGSCTDDCAVGSDWACVGRVSVPVPTTDTITGNLTIVEAAAQSVPVPNLKVRGCETLDTECTNDPPFTPTWTSDANGKVTVELPAKQQSGRFGFNGYIEVADPSGVHSTTLLFANIPLTQSGYTATVIDSTPALAKELADALGLPYDPSQAGLVITAFDCVDRQAPGVSFDILAGTTPVPIYYQFNGLLSVNETMTDASGTAVTQMPSRGVSITAKEADTGATIGTAEIFGRPGTLSLIALAPSR